MKQNLLEEGGIPKDSCFEIPCVSIPGVLPFPREDIEALGHLHIKSASHISAAAGIKLRPPLSSRYKLTEKRLQNVWGKGLYTLSQGYFFCSVHIDGTVDFV